MYNEIKNKPLELIEFSIKNGVRNGFSFSKFLHCFLSLIEVFEIFKNPTNIDREHICDPKNNFGFRNSECFQICDEENFQIIL